jgi:hypothetical protein
MSDLRDPTTVDAEGAPVDQGQGSGGSVQIEAAAGLTVAAQPGAGAVPQVEPALEFENLQLLSRFLMGIAFMGSDALMRRLRFSHEEMEADPGTLGSRADLEQESELELLRYLSIGLFARGRNLRRSVAARARDLGEEASVIMTEGRREEQMARLLANNTIGEIIDEVLDFISESPEVDQLIKDIVGQQTSGLAGVVADNTRTVTVTGDYLVETVARRLLRRKPRRELSPSPLAGEQQDMYSVDTSETGGPDHG